jgi:predicted transcriptional regulator
VKSKKERKAEAKAAKPAKGKKAEKDAEAPAADTPKAGKKAKAEKPAKEKRVKMTPEEKAAKKAEKKAARRLAKGTKVDDRVAVDQTPQEVAREHKLTPVAIELLVHLHEKTKDPTTMAEIATNLKTDTKTVAARAKSLIDAGLVVKDEKAKTLDIVGKRQEGFTDLFKVITKLTKDNKAMPTSAKIGQALWADPKKPGKKDTVRYGRAAGRLLTGAFRMGVVKQFTQPRRKFSADKIRKLYAVVE